MTTPAATVANPGSTQKKSLYDTEKELRQRVEKKFGPAAEVINPHNIARLPDIDLGSKFIKVIEFSDLEGHPAVRGSFPMSNKKGHVIALRLLVILPTDKACVSKVEERIEILTHYLGKFQFTCSTAPKSTINGSLLNTESQNESFKAVKRLLSGKQISAPNKKIVPKGTEIRLAK